MTEIEAAYIAGFLDGEGTIALTRNHTHKSQLPVNWGKGRTPSYALRIRIANTNKSVLEWIKIVVGGSIHRKKFYPGLLQGYDWYIHGKTAEPFLKQIYPYLKVKKLQAEVALRYINTLQSFKDGQKRLSDEIVQEREQLRFRMVELNHPSNC